MKFLTKKVFSYFIILIILIFLFYYLKKNLESIKSVRWWANPGLLSLHLVLLSFNFVLFVKGWQKFLKIAETNLSVKIAVCSWLIPNIGKYVPGKVFMVAGRIALLNLFGVRKATTFAVVIWEHVFLILSTMPFCLFIIFNYYGDYSIKIIIIVICLLSLMLLIALNPAIIQWIINYLLRMFRRFPLEIVLQRKIVLNMFIFYLSFWIVYGISGIILAYAVGIGDKVPLFLLFNVFIFSWLVGFVSMITPGGIGVREGALILMLKPYVAMPELIVFVIIARIAWIFIELLSVIVGLILGNQLKIKNYFNLSKSP